MVEFSDVTFSEAPRVVAPDGSDVRILADASRGSMIRCTLRPGAVSRPVYHRTVEELWCCVAGRGTMWRSGGDSDVTVDLHPGASLNIPIECRFQFRSEGEEPLAIVIVTMPPWPGEDEAVPCEGPWTPTV